VPRAHHILNGDEEEAKYHHGEDTRSHEEDYQAIHNGNERKHRQFAQFDDHEVPDDI
jgi:hypothetical protein